MDKPIVTLSHSENEVYGVYVNGTRISFFSPGDDPGFWLAELCHELGAKLKQINLEARDDVPPEKLPS